MEGFQEEKKMFLHQTHVAHFTPATVRKSGKSTYIEYQYENECGAMVRKRTYLNAMLKKLPTKKAQKEYLNNVVDMTNERLRLGWTPDFAKMENTHAKGAVQWREVFVKYRQHIDELLQYGDLRKSGAQTYASDLNLLEDYLSGAPVLSKRERHKKIVRQTERMAFPDIHEQMPVSNAHDRITYIYQFTDDVLRDFLLWAKEEREVNRTTLNNYRRWLVIFCNWLKERGYIKHDLMQDVKAPVAKVTKDKRETYYPAPLRQRIFDYFAKTDSHMLLACYLCYYCFIRPKEIMQLRICNIHLQKSLIFIPKEVSKNEKDAWITLPTTVSKLMLELDIFAHPGQWLLFDNTLAPAPPHTHINNGSAIRDRWTLMREALHLPRKYRFYDLKHSGITDMVNSETLSARQVQMQARHHSIQMTERYIRPTPPEANETIKNLSWLKK